MKKTRGVRGCHQVDENTIYGCYTIREMEIESLFEEIMAQNFPDLRKEMAIEIHKLKEHITIKLLKVKTEIIKLTH